MTTKRELRADKIAVLAGLVSNPGFADLDFDARFELYVETMTLVDDVHQDYPNDDDEPKLRSSFDWNVAVNTVLETGVAFRRDYPNKNTAQTTTSKLKK